MVIVLGVNNVFLGISWVVACQKQFDIKKTKELKQIGMPIFTIFYQL